MMLPTFSASEAQEMRDACVCLLNAVGGAGGKRLVDEGALAGVAAVHGIHVFPSLPAGTYGTKVRQPYLSDCSIAACKSLKGQNAINRKSAPA